MSMAMTTFLLIFSALVFFGAALWLVIVNVLSHKRWHWALFAASLFLLAISLARLAYFSNRDLRLPESFDTLELGLLLAAALLALAGAIWQRRNFQTDQLILQTAQDELAHYKIHFEQDPRLLLIKDLQGNYLAANPAFANFLGKQIQSLTGETDFSFFPRSTANSLRQFDEKAIQARQNLTQEIELIGMPGSRWFQLTRTCLNNQAGQPVGLLLACRDLSKERMQLAQNEAWQRGIQILLDFSMDMFQSKEKTTSMDQLLSWTERLAETEHVGLWRFHSDGPLVVLEKGAGKLEGLVGKKLKTGEDLPWKVWKNGRSVFIPDFHSWSDASNLIKKSGLQSGIGVPLKMANQVVYVLAVYYESLSPALVEPRMGLLELMAQAAFESHNTQQKVVDLSRCLEEQAESENILQLQARLEHTLAGLAVQFINLDVKKFDEAFRQALKSLARYAGVDRVFLAVLPNGIHTRLVDIELFGATSNPATATLSYGKGEFLLQPDFRWAMEKLNQLEPVYIADAAQLPADDSEALPFLNNRGLRSFAAVPLVSNRSMTGILALESYQSPTDWPEALFSILKTAADLFINLLERQENLKSEHADRQKDSQQINLLEQRNQEYAMISEMADLLQACRTADEAYPIITRYLQRLLPEKSGALYIFHDATDPAEKVLSWGIAAPGEGEHELTTNECWGLRRGRMYLIKDPQTETICGHIKEKIQYAYVCVPMLAQGRAIGVLHLRANPGSNQAEAFSEDQQRLARRAAEYIGMSLTNLRLRDELRSQAIRDPLTGLFNRRYMEETLDREIRRAQRHNTVISVIMFDIDRMKPINDKFGHDAGDLLLKSLGSTLIKMFRGEDVACRFGGDEFTIVLPEASLADTWRRAEHVRQAVRNLNLRYEGKPLGEITLSIGVAAYPDHGQTAERVLLSADAASYTAKSEGGDRIMVGRVPES